MTECWRCEWEHRWEIRNTLPSWASFAVYQLWLNERIIYIGKTTQLVSRIDSHVRTKVINAVTVTVFETEAEMNEGEAVAIHAEHPPLNRQRPRKCGYYGLAWGRRMLARYGLTPQEVVWQLTA